jgi:hypothetical protein
MEYNEGYKVHLSSADTLVYPTSCPPCPPPFAKRNRFPWFAQTAHFSYLGNTSESYSIVVNSIELKGKQAEVGDEIGVFTPSGQCVGGGVWQGDVLGIAVWQDDERTELVEGFREGEHRQRVIFRAFSLPLLIICFNNACSFGLNLTRFFTFMATTSFKR